MASIVNLRRSRDPPPPSPIPGSSSPRPSRTSYRRPRCSGDHAAKLTRDMFGVQILVQALDLPRSILFVESYKSIVDKMVNFQENKSDATFAHEMAHTAQNSNWISLSIAAQLSNL